MIAFETGLLGLGSGGIGREAESTFNALAGEELLSLTWRDGPSVNGESRSQFVPRKFALGYAYLTGRLFRLRTPKGATLYLPQVLPFKGGGEIVVRLHDLFPVTNPEWFTSKSVRIFSRALRGLVKADAQFLCDSSTSEAELLRLYPQAKSLGVLHCYIPPLTGADRCGKCHGCSFDTNQRFFLSVGTIEPRKNYPFLISFVKKHSQFTIVVVGRPGWMSDEVLYNLRNTPGIHYLERICDGSLKNLYSTAHAFLSPSLSEGFNIPACEAEQFGLPVLLSDIPVHRELHPNEELIPLGDMPAWKAAMSINHVKREVKVFPTVEEYAADVKKLLQRR